MQPDHQPAKAYVVMTDTGIPVFSAPTFERAMERITAMLRSDVEDRCMRPRCDSYCIACVEAE